jgi:hypothetical protein
LWVLGYKKQLNGNNFGTKLNLKKAGISAIDPILGPSSQIFSDFYLKYPGQDSNFLI